MKADELRRELKAVMARENLTPINVASACDVDDATVTRFLDGIGMPRRITLRAFYQFVASKVSPTTKQAAS
jgi:hypothetical protein